MKRFTAEYILAAILGFIAGGLFGILFAELLA